MKNKVETLFGDNKFILAMLHLKGENDRDVLENAKRDRYLSTKWRRCGDC